MARGERESGRSKPVETDERFPSGPWEGFWLQRWYSGRQYMRGLSLEFREGKVIGSGSDRVGRFEFSGTYDVSTGKVSLVKAYRRHSARYSGQNEDDGKWVWGVWSIGLDRGGFHMWPAGEGDPAELREGKEEEVSVEEGVGV
jgi:hypothetical protein